jgi:radical S-adenosyl methionine domain-containing protein 2
MNEKILELNPCRWKVF